MSPELEKQLYDQYPKLYEKLVYFEINDGWFNLIKDLSEKLKDKPILTVQVKEKFGGLRYYFDEIKCCDEVHTIIEEAEDKSYKICEITGAEGVLCVKNGWFKTLSAEKATELGYIKYIKPVKSS